MKTLIIINQIKYGLKILHHLTGYRIILRINNNKST